VPEAPSVFGEADMIVEVKEPQPAELELLERRHLLFAYLHLAATGS
jgi:alanine dehydrogenase